MRRFRVGGLVFSGEPGDVTYTIESDSVRGWLIDGVDMRTEQIDRPAAHGAFNLPGFLTGRSISWGGLILTDTPEEQNHAMLRLSGLLADGGTDRLVGENTDTRWADVARGGEFDMKMLRHGKVASYRLQLWAANPRIFGETREFPSGTPAYHYGNFPATPRPLVGAGSGGYTVSGPGGRTVVVGSAPSAAHYIDFANGGLFTNAGARQVGAITTYRPWTVAPGQTVSASISGSRSLSQRVVDTFI